VLDTAPATVTIRFTEPLEAGFSSATLEDANGDEVEGVTSTVEDADRFAIVMTVPAGLAEGTYLVRWRNLSSLDGHGLEGFFPFSVGAASGTPLGIGSNSDSGPPSWLVSAGKWIAMLGLALLIAYWPFRLGVWRPGEFEDNDPAPAPPRLFTIATAVALAGALLTLYSQAWINSPDGDIWPRLRDTLQDTRYGSFWSYRSAGIIVVAVLTWVAIRARSKPLGVLAMLVGLALPLTLSQVSHASAQETGRATLVAADWIHLTAALVWAGGLAWLTYAIHEARVDAADRLRIVVPRFSAVALGCWALIIPTGIYSGWVLVGTRDGLTDTSYGTALLIKLATIVPVLLLAAINLLVLGPRLGTGRGWTIGRLRSSTVVEVALMICLVFTAARLIGIQPAVDTVGAGDNPQVAATVDLDGQSADLAVTPAQPGPNSYIVRSDAIPEGERVEVLLRITPPGEREAQKEIELARADDGSFTGQGLELAVVGDWGVEVIVREIGSFQWQGDVTVPIAMPEIVEPQSHGWRFDTVGTIGLLLLAGNVVLLVCGALATPTLRTLTVVYAIPITLAGAIMLLLGHI
jgi:copper transport protein